MFSDFLSFLRAGDDAADSGLSPSSPPDSSPAVSPPTPVAHAPSPSVREAERSCARVLATEDGRRLLSYLQSLTSQRVLGPDCPDARLRYLEGQRALVTQIIRLAERGRAG